MLQSGVFQSFPRFAAIAEIKFISDAVDYIIFFKVVF